MNSVLDKVALKENTNTDFQTIYINIDDSGKISAEKDKFITQYKSIINDIKCKYCNLNKDLCNKTKCPELKHSNLKTMILEE